MSIDIMNRILWREDLPTMEKFVGLILASMADDDDFSCYPTKETVARLAGCVPRTVVNCTQRLEEKGLLRIQKRRDLSNKYFFRMENLPHVERPQRTPKQLREARAGPQYVEPGLFEDQHVRPTVAPKTTGESPSSTGERRSMTGESRSKTGERDAPRTIRESSEESSGESGTELVPANVDNLPLPLFVKAEWEKLKADFANIGDCRQVTESMARLVRDRAKEHAQTGESLHDVWRVVFTEIRKSRFLTGQLPPGQGRNTRFRLTLSTLLKPHIFREAINGKYADTSADNGNFDPDTGEVLGPGAAATRGTIERFRHARERTG